MSPIICKTKRKCKRIEGFTPVYKGTCLVEPGLWSPMPAPDMEARLLPNGPLWPLRPSARREHGRGSHKPKSAFPLYTGGGLSYPTSIICGKIKPYSWKGYTPKGKCPLTRRIFFVKPKSRPGKPWPAKFGVLWVCLLVLCSSLVWGADDMFGKLMLPPGFSNPGYGPDSPPALHCPE